MSEKNWGGSGSDRPTAGTLAVTDAYFAIPSYEQGKAVPRVNLVLHGELTTPEGKKIDWSFDWGTSGFRDDPTVVMADPGERSDTVRFLNAEGQPLPEVDSETGLQQTFSKGSDIVKYLFDGAQKVGVPLDERDMDPNRASSWIGLILEIENRPTGRTYESKTLKDAEGKAVIVEVKANMLTGFKGTFEVAGVTGDSGSTASPSTAASNGHAELTDDDLLAMARSANGNYIAFVEAAMNASKSTSSPMNFAHPKLSQTGPIWSAVNA